MIFKHWMTLVVASHFALPAGAEIILSDFEDQIGKPKGRADRGNSVSIWGGSTQNQSGKSIIDGTEFDLDDQSSDFIMGIEVDYWWRMKKVPLEVGIGFEGSFLATELAGARDFFDTSVAPPSATSDKYSTDANAAIFLLNAYVALDLYRYRARLRGLSRLKPYAGGGIGGAQFWFRNATSMYDPASTVTTEPFATDQFVFAYKGFAGLEFMVNRKVSVFAEYQHYYFEGLKDVDPFDTGAWVGGVRIIYDARDELEEEEE